jgi:hypothetical protein
MKLLAKNFLVGGRWELGGRQVGVGGDLAISGWRSGYKRLALWGRELGFVGVGYKPNENSCEI